MARGMAVGLALAVVAALALVGYEVGTGRWGVPGASALGTLRVLVEDAPGAGEWAHVNVTFARLEVHEANAGNASGWHTIPFTPSRTVDLKALTSAAQLLGEAKLSPGKYTQLRIAVEAVVGTLANGTRVDIRVPPGEIILNRPFNVTAGGTTRVILDIPLDNLRWDGRGWLLSPVVGSVRVEG